MKKKYPLIELTPGVKDFRDRFIAATEIEGTLGGIITCYKTGGRYLSVLKVLLPAKG